MIYCPGLAGHRQIYCDVLTDFFVTKGFKVVLAVGAPQGEKGNEEHFSPYIEQYRGHPLVTIIDLSHGKFSHLGTQRWHVVRRLQRDLEVEWTFFVDGDALRSGLSLGDSLRSRPRLLGKNLAVFLNVSFIYYPIPSSRYSLFKSLRGLAWWTRFQLKENSFYRIVLRLLWSFDACFFTDENFVRNFDYREYHYLPEIHRSFRFKGLEKSGYEGEIADYQDFLRDNKGRDVVLYFGNAEPRKGYDYLLRLVHDHPDLVFVHCGRHATEEAYEYPVDAFRDSLRSSGRLFEFLGGFVVSPELVDKFFSSTKFILLPYRNHYKSSGLLIQATEYGKPVLVPDIGLVNSLVVKNRIGSTYKHLRYEDFESQFVRFRSEHIRYVDRVMEFRKRFAKEETFAALERGVGLA